jgi:DNA-binding CsgD family transcriptional regulator
VELLERTAHLQQLQTLLREAEAGRGRLVQVGGEAGVGKTALVRQFCGQSSGGVRILEGACDPLSTPRPLGPLADIAASVGGELARQLVDGGRRDDVFRTFLAEISQGPRPTVVVFEDVHWADEATLDLLRFLGRRIGGAPSILIATYRDDEVGPSHPLRVAMGDLASSAVARLSLAPLSPGAVARLGEGSGLDPVALHRQTGGNPLFVTEVLASETGGIPPTVRDAVLARVARLSPAGRAMLEGAAVIGSRIEAWLLTEVGGPRAEAVDECIELGLLAVDGDAVAFRHELSRQAVLEAMSPARRLAQHRLVLAILRSRPVRQDDLAILAHHAELAADGDAVRAYAPAAAERAATLRAHREAAAQYARALRFADGLTPDQQAAMLEGRSYECYLTGQLSEAVAARESAVETWRSLGNRLKEGESLRWLSRLAWYQGRRAEAEQAGRAALEILEALPPGPQLAWAYSNLSQLHMLAREHAQAIDWGTKAAALAEQLGETEVRIHATTNVASARIVSDDERGWPELEACLREARAAGFEDHAGRIYGNLISSATKLCRLAQAERYGDEGLAYCREHDLDLYRLHLLGWRAMMLLRRARWTDACEAAEVVLANPQASPVSRIQALVALGCVRVRRGDAGAMDALDEALRLALVTAELQRLGPVRAARAEAAWVRGDHDEAGREARVGLDLAIKHDDQALTAELALWLWRSGGLSKLPAAATGPFARQIAEGWEAAAQGWQELGCPYEAALAMLDGDAAAVRQALAIFGRLGARPVAALATDRLRALGVRDVRRGVATPTPATASRLSERETEVATLVARGYSNRQIAEALVIGQRTAENHVAHICAKLGLNSRSQVAAWAVRHGLLADDSPPPAARTPTGG